ncbi:MAG: TetR/AcrR family transcriptional regulator [Bacteriovoracaceae bacterium]|nr:TetR/AcrR family transcriptional regulator [Bacteriovoracaceae bacterium]
MTGPTDTKKKIFKAANELFAHLGYDGTSIRDIANKAEVNVSAINYHFKNKEILYIEIFNHNYNWLKEEIVKIRDKHPDDVKNFVWEMFSTLVGHGPQIRNCFKFILDDNVVNLKECKKRCHIIPYGPPGGEILMDVIKNEVGEGVSNVAIDWAVHNIFGFTTHYSLMFNSKIIKEHLKQTIKCNEETMKLDILLYVEAIMEFIKNHPEKFQRME